MGTSGKLFGGEWESAGVTEVGYQRTEGREQNILLIGRIMIGYNDNSHSHKLLSGTSTEGEND